MYSLEERELVRGEDPCEFSLSQISNEETDESW